MIPRCPNDGYALIRGVCPICEGKQAGDRTPMVAPLPKAAPAKPPRVRRFVFKRRKAS